MTKRNRTAGHAFERRIAQAFRDLGYTDACTSRAESRNRDDAGVDLCNTGPWNVQCKYTQKAPNMHELLKSMPDEAGQANVVFHKRKNGGVTVTMSEQDFYGWIRQTTAKITAGKIGYWFGYTNLNNEGENHE